MIRLYPEQLTAHLQEGPRAVYLLAGNDPLLLQESQDAIYASARQQGFTEHHQWHIDTATDWQAIFACCTAMSLFASRQTLLLILPDSGGNASVNQQLATLVSLLHGDLLLIIRLTKFTTSLQNSSWCNAIKPQSVLVSCQTPEHEHLPRWLARRARQQNITLDEAASQLLCYCYEGNLLALAQALERLSLIWTDGKLTLPRVEQAVNEAASFTPFHWIDALLAGKSKRALHVLQQLHEQGVESVILLRTLQRELLQLVSLQRQSTSQPLQQVFDQQRIWKNRRPLLSAAVKRLSGQQLRQAIHLLARCELIVKQDFASAVHTELSEISLLLSQPQPAGRHNGHSLQLISIPGEG